MTWSLFRMLHGCKNKNASYRKQTLVRWPSDLRVEVMQSQWQRHCSTVDIRICRFHCSRYEILFMNQLKWRRMSLKWFECSKTSNVKGQTLLLVVLVWRRMQHIFRFWPSGGCQKLKWSLKPTHGHCFDKRHTISQQLFIVYRTDCSR